MTCLVVALSGDQDRSSGTSGAVRMLGAPLKAWRARRRARRAVLDFSTIDNHTLDDIGLRRSPFTAAAANDDLRHDAA